MSILDWFGAKIYRCKYCFESCNKAALSLHGKDKCTDQRRLWDLHVIKKGKEYIVQGKYYYSPHYMYTPMSYWDDIKSFKTLREAKKFKTQLSEQKGWEVVG
jgi:hypothetical protein